MKSTPAVFHAPVLSALSTPNVATPAIFKNGYYPWAVKTPEASPMCWDKEPPRLGRSEEPVLSRELLRSVCEPFFEQMLTALQEKLEQQQKQQREEQLRSTQVMQHQSFLPLQRLDPMPDDESTDVEEVGAFASLLFSGPSSSPSTSDKSDIAVTTKHEPDQSSDPDPEKSVMVCRHWKTKGWCRMESNCKFQHPEHKRGVAVPPKASGMSSTSRGDISGADCPGVRTTLSLTDALRDDCQSLAPVAAAAAQKKKRTKARSLKGSSEEALHSSLAVAAAPCNEQSVACPPCIPTIQFFARPDTVLE